MCRARKVILCMEICLSDSSHLFPFFVPIDTFFLLRLTFENSTGLTSMDFQVVRLIWKLRVYFIEYYFAQCVFNIQRHTRQTCRISKCESTQKKKESMGTKSGDKRSKADSICWLKAWLIQLTPLLAYFLLIRCACWHTPLSTSQSGYGLLGLSLFSYSPVTFNNGRFYAG